MSPSIKGLLMNSWPIETTTSSFLFRLPPNAILCDHHKKDRKDFVCFPLRQRQFRPNALFRRTSPAFGSIPQTLTQRSLLTRLLWSRSGNPIPEDSNRRHMSVRRDAAPDLLWRGLESMDGIMSSLLMTTKL